METIGLIISMVLTIMVLSYILGDNPAFKAAEYIFVGVSVAYLSLITWHQIIVPFFQQSLEQGGSSFLLKVPPLLLSLLLLFKVHPTQSKVANGLGAITLAFLIGVGAALSIEGALFGTLLPQLIAATSINLNPASPLYANAPEGKFYLHNDFWSNIVVIIGTVGTLMYFTFAYRPQKYWGGFREGFVNFWAGIGRLIILITLGALFSNTVSSRIALLLSRIQFLADGFRQLIGG